LEFVIENYESERSDKNCLESILEMASEIEEGIEASKL
jgi:hypothetical protein